MAKAPVKKAPALSPQMLTFLSFVRRASVNWNALSTQEANLFRELHARKMLTVQINGIISITPKGKKELPK